MATNSNQRNSLHHSPEMHRFPPFSQREKYLRTQACYRQSGVPKEAQDNGLSASMSYGRQTPPRRPSGERGIFPTHSGIFPDKKTETIDLETVVLRHHLHNLSRRSNMADIAQLSSALPTLSISSIEDSYDIGEKLGEGAYAVVNKAIHKTDGKMYAIKIVTRASLDRDTEHALQDEIAILGKLRHEHIMGLYESVTTIDKYYLVTEYLEGGELFDRIVEKEHYTENEARDVCVLLFETMKYIHSCGIAHRDLKPENLLLAYRHSESNKQSDSDIKIADFGFAKVAPHDDSCNTMCGTPGYLAPEVIRKKKYGTQCDMWSMGVIVFILLGGYPPFHGSSPKVIFEKTVAGQIDFDPDYWGGISTSAKDMIRSLLDLDPTKRANAGQILSHPWMKTDRTQLRRSSLAQTQVELKKIIARTRFKKAIIGVMFVNKVSLNGIFSGKNKHECVKANEGAAAELIAALNFDIKQFL